ncbi:MAG: hypothetical protein IJI67_00080 [Clostridia bacterium]|nr:hypothetical protein [Clostridia bacterium]
MHRFQKPLSILLAVIIALGAFTAIPFSAAAATAVSYIERAWNPEAQTEQERILETEKTCTDYTDWSDVTGTSLAPGWYVVSKNCTVGSRMIVASGEVHLILCDGVTMNLQKGINIKADGNLYIYGQANDTGKIYANIHFSDGTYDHECALIGGVKGENCGNITVYGGTIDLTYLSGTGACIGGAEGRGGGMTRIYGGHVTCQQQAGSGAAIGGGYHGPASRFELEAIQIYGGDIDAKSWGGASIGSGIEGNSGKDGIGIYGGTIKAQCSTGAGIGGGQRGKNGPIHIYGGDINTVAYAEGYTGAGIGSGLEQNQGGTIDISGGVVVATSRNGAGIGAGKEASASQINISGGTIVASSTEGGAGIGGGADGGNGGTIHIENANVFACSSNYNSMADASDDILKCLNKTNPNPSDHGESVVGVFLGLLALIVDGFGADQSGCGIGGGSCGGSVSSITIQNSNVTAKSGNYSAAIGSGEEGDIDTITIENSTVTAESGDYGAAIGTGDEADNKVTIDIKNSTIDAASGDDAAAIGTGNEVDSAPDITITDSKVTANGGEYAASIGGGDDVSGGNITIDHSTVIADRALYYYLEEPHDEMSIREHRNCDGAGIGGGEDGDGGTIVIQNNSNVTVHGGPYAAGIGGGDNGDGGNISITGSTVKAYAGEDAAAIGGGEGGDGGKITILNSNIYAEGKGYGAGIGNGEDGNETNIEINGSNTTVEAFAGSDGKAVAIGQGGNGIFYTYSITRSFDPTLLCDAGSDKSHTARYHGDDRYTAAKVAKYMYLFPCEHNNRKWVYDSDTLHVPQCTECELRIYSGAGYHDWDENNVCTVCGCSAVMREITFVEQDANGNQVTFKQSGPVSGTIKAPVSTHAPEGMEFVCWSESGAYYAGAGEDIGVSNRERTFEAVYLPVTQATYIDRDGAEKTVTARRLTHTNLELTAGRYVVESNIQSRNAMTISGDVELILADGATFSFYQGFDYYDLDHIDCLITAQDTSSNLSVYGQTQQTGTLLLGKRHTVLTDFAQYGGVVDSETGFFESTKNCVISGGTFKAAVLVCDRAAILGGNATIGNMPLNKSLQLAWQQKSDRIHFDSLESENTSVVANQAFCDENGNVYKGTLSAEQVSALQGKTLMPYVEHNYAEPEWVWLDEYTNAQAVFRCKDCEEEQTISAKVTWEDEGNSRTAHAVCTFNGDTYTDTRTVNIMWNITAAQTEHGTISADKAHAKAGEPVCITTTPDEGYVLDALEVSDSEGGHIEVENNKFKMPESDVSITASFKITTHTVRWVAGAQTLETDENVPYGTTPEYNGATPASYFDGEAEYVFAGWSPAVAPVTEDAVYTATYAASGKIRVPYINENGTQSIATAAILTGSETVLESGWYVARSEINYQDKLKISEGVKLILADGAHLRVHHFDYADANKLCTLRVFAQSGKTGSMQIQHNSSLTGIDIYGGNVNLPFMLTMSAGFYAGNIEIGNLFVPQDAGSITLGCANDDDRIKIGTLNNGTVAVVQGQTLYDGKALYSGSLSSAQVSALDGKTLRKAPRYTVRWMIGDTLAETDENVLVTSTPSFDSTLPATYIEGQTHYCFSGWSDGEKVYAPDALPAVSADVTYTAVYTQGEHDYGEPVWNWAADCSSATAVFTCSLCQRCEAVDAVVTPLADGKTYRATAIFNGEEYSNTKEMATVHRNGASLTLNDGVSLNVYLDADSYGLEAGKAVVKLTYNHNADIGKEKNITTDIIALGEAAKYMKSGDTYSGTYKFSFRMAPAQFADDITIGLYASAEVAEPVFTATTNVKAKCEQVKTLAEKNDAYASLAALCAALEDYCIASQVYFAYDAPQAPAYNNLAVTTMAADDMEVPETSVGIPATGFSFTVVSALEVNIFYSGTLKVPGVSIASAKGSDSVRAEVTEKGNRNCINIKGIASGNMDNLVTVNTTAGDVTLAATNIAKAIAASTNNTDYANLARALYLYSVQASRYFGC